tara:strand:- start:256 stop:531 length:276 start_codon:yes stop_codon:yes gene_type:complete
MNIPLNPKPHTNSEMDSKTILTPELTDSQIDDIIKQYVEIKVDRMDTQELVEHVTDNLRDWYSDFSLEELESVISGDDEDLYDELVENVTT